MRIMIIGSGAREHAITEACARSPHAPELVCFGSHRNPGIAAHCSSYRIGDITRASDVLAFASECSPDLAVIGPEAPLEAGIADVLEEASIPVVGPRKAAARIETSKSFCRSLLSSSVPEALPVYFHATNRDEAARALDVIGDHFVIKADGLCGGKGVKVSGEHLHSREEALDFCMEALRSAPCCLIEEKLVGEEFSLLSFTDGNTCLHMPAVQDHKRAGIGDTGSNTGGMGSYSGPWGVLPFLSSSDITKAGTINETVVHIMRTAVGVPYRGILYGGFMATAKGVFVIEYNARFGDPEALNLIPLMESDVVDAFLGIVSGNLGNLQMRFSSYASVCKYLVPPGYPESGKRGVQIPVPHAPPKNVYLFYGSLHCEEEELVTLGSRTLAVTALGKTIEEAQELAESYIQQTKGSLTYRPDIGTRELVERRIRHMDELRGRPLRIAVLGSTKGTSLQPLINELKDFGKEAALEVVVSDRKNAYILERASMHGIPGIWINTKDALGKKKSREAFDAELASILTAYRADLVLCVGFMRILSPQFCETWNGRVLNIHPSLLPDFAGGMDMDVHQQVLDARRRESGCTLHFVTPDVDAGPVFMQKKCPVFPDDTAAALKQRVQDLEGHVLIEAVKIFAENRFLV